MTRAGPIYMYIRDNEYKTQARASASGIDATFARQQQTDRRQCYRIGTIVLLLNYRTMLYYYYVA